MRSRAPWLMLAPFLAVFAAFLVWPLLRSLVLAGQRSAGPGHQEWIGAGNLAFLLQDPLFWTAVGNTVLYAVLFVGVQLPLALALALALDARRLRARAWLRWAFFSPHLVGTVFIGVVFWKLLAKDPNAPVNAVWLTAAGWMGIAAAPIDWLGDPRWAMASVLAAGLWMSVGYAMIYILAALQGVDRTLYEAAAIDGASAWQRLRHVTLPGIAPTLGFLALVALIGALQLFELPYVLTGGPGPDQSTLTVVGYLYQQGFETGNLGYACAIGWALTAGIMLCSLAQLRLTRLHRDG